MHSDVALIVDADELEREALISMVSSTGWGTVGVATAEEGLSRMNGSSFPVALVGRGPDGADPLGLLREVARLYPETEVLVVSGDASLEAVLSSFRAGACDYLAKPIADAERVTAAVTRAADRARAAREKRAHLESLAQKNEILLSANNFLAEQVKRDGLTGLYNHRHLQEALAKETARAVRYKRVYSLLFADVDHFKQYNDRQGHLAGDKVLRMIAEILQKSVRNSDLVARYGGEEFVILLPETNGEKARVVAQRVLKGIESHPFPGRETQPGGQLTISIGVAAFPEDGDHPAELIRQADRALYEAKRGGGNAFRMAG
jgi:diguanylate cyclase (GGDEF)-like protein